MENKQSDMYRPTGRWYHSTLVVHDVLYMWGGLMDELPYGIHDEEHTSHVDMFYLTKGLWQKKPTSGKPPLGVAGYSCTSINNKLCYFGGGCGHDPIEGVCDGYHNSINVLDTTTLHWQQLSPTTDDGVMRRANSGMISFSCDNEDLAFIIGGRGSVPKSRQLSASYHESSSSYCYTNECNIFNTTKSQWSVPIISGQCPPPCNGFTLNELPHNRGIMFGGYGSGGVCYDDIYIIKLTKDTVHFTKLSKPDDSTIYWPMKRYRHASTITTSDGHTVMAVIGGSLADDSCIYNYDTGKWEQLVLPQSVSDRCHHSLSVFTISHHCVVLVMFGGYFHGTLNDTTIIELVYANNQWIPVAVSVNYDYTKVKKYLLMLHRQGYFIKDQLQQQSLAHQQQLLQLQQQLDTERRMRRSMALQLDKLQESSANISTGTKEVTMTDIAIQCTTHDNTSEAIIQQQSDDIEVLKKELYKYQHSSDVTVKRDMGVQFTLMEPVSDNLHQVVVVSEKLFTIVGDSISVLDWEEYGFRVNVPHGSLKATETCDVAVKAIACGLFKFPKNTDIVSAVYAISLSTPLSQPITIEMEHCVDIHSNHQCQYLSFVIAHTKQQELPYEFKFVEGGEFTPGDRYGRITSKTFCILGVACQKPSKNDGPQEDPTSSYKYLAQVFYAQVSLQPASWKLLFLVTKSFKSIVKYAVEELKEVFEDVRLERDWMKEFSFKTGEDNVCVPLVVFFPLVEEYEKWSIIPTLRESTFVKEDVDRFRIDSAHIPVCEVRITAGSKAEPCFAKDVEVTGCVEELGFRISRLLIQKKVPVTDNSSQQSPVQQQAENMLDDGDKSKELAHLLSQILQGHCADLNAFLKGATLQAFANKMCEAGIITVELRDNPVYNEIEGQFTAALNISTTKDEFETCCKDFLDALKSQGKALERFAKKIATEWKKKSEHDLEIVLNF